MKCLSVFVIILLIAYTPYIYGQTSIAGGNYSGTWLKSASPYNINGDILVPSGSTLTIEPGVKINFKGHYKFVVEGRLLAIGTPTDTIVFTADDTTGYYKKTNVGWCGIRFTNNNSTDSSKIIYCKIQFGKATGISPDFSGGAIYIDKFNRLLISNSKLCFNSASTGAAIYANECNLLINSTIIENNNSLFSGGSIYSYIGNTKIKNCLFTNNIAQNGSGGSFFSYFGNNIILNSTFANNKALDGGAFYIEGNPTFKNCIFWNNTATNGNQIYTPDGLCSFYYCDIQGGKEAFAGSGSGAAYTGTYSNNINLDPKFISSSLKQFTLNYNSPCLNAGTPDTTGLYLGNRDIIGNKRVLNSRIEMGAYEIDTSIFAKAPAVPQNLTINTFPTYYNLNWKANNELDLAQYNIYESSLNDTTKATLIASKTTNSIKINNPDYSANKFYWVKAIDQLGLSSYFSKPVSLLSLDKICNDSGFIAYYPFNGNSLDKSGNSNNGTVLGAVLTTGRFGNTDNAYSFDGSNDYIDIPDNNKWFLQNNFTILLWVKFSNTANSAKIINQSDGGGSNRKWFLYYENNKLNFHAFNNDLSTNTTFSSNQLTLTNNQWYMIGLVREGNNFSFWIDGKQCGTYTWPYVISNPTSSLQIGACTNDGPWSMFKGCIDDVSICSRSLSESDIAALFSNKYSLSLINHDTAEYNITKKILLSISSDSVPLVINNVANSNSEFVPDNFSFTVPANSKSNLNITYHPTKTGIYVDTLSLFSDHGLIRTILQYTSYTGVCKLLVNDTIFTKSHSPYFINCDNLGIDKGHTLTIEPGVKVYLAKDRYLIVNGTLIAKGTKTDSICFESFNSDYFNRIQLSDSATAEFEFTKIQNGLHGIWVNMGVGSLKISNSRILNCGSDGLVMNGKTFVADNCEISYNKGKGLSFKDGNFTLSNMFIHDNSAEGIFSDNAKKFSISKSVIYNNSGTGISFIYNGPGMYIKDCKIEKNGGSGVSGWSIVADNDSIINNEKSGLAVNNSFIKNCVIENNKERGVEGDRDTVFYSSIKNNLSHGIKTNGSVIFNNTISGNTNCGIIGYSVNMITHNKITLNKQDGIQAYDSDSIKYNEISNNLDDGIETAFLPRIQFNNICNNGKYAINSTRTTKQENIIATNNYFCLSDAVQISSKIYDYSDNSMSDKVIFLPFKTSTINKIFPPSELVELGANLGSILIGWHDNSNNETGFIIQRSQNRDNGFINIDTVTSNSNNFRDDNVVSNSGYFYRVRAISSSDSSEFSNVLYAETQKYFSEITGSDLPGVDNSASAWGDYNNDGYLDILICGRNGGNVITKIFKNNGDGTFTEQNLNLPGVRNGAVAFGDYDNDNDLDILLTGRTSDNNCFSAIYRNNYPANSFTKANITLQGVQKSSVAWADYNNDGYLDFIICGTVDESSATTISKIYKNDKAGNFTALPVSITGLFNCSVKFSDYDNDGDADIILMGVPGLGMAPITRIYKNNGNDKFDAITTSITNVSFGSLALEDYNNDNILDVFTTGDSGGGIPFSKLFKNNGNNSFTAIANTNISDLQGGSATWGDFNNDNFSDLLISGTNSSNIPNTHIYVNNNGVISRYPVYNLSGITYGNSSWGDFDNDGDLDILLTGYGGTNELTKIFQNNLGFTKPTLNAPTGLSNVLKKDTITLKWDKAANASSYNVFVSKNLQSVTTLSPMANINNGSLLLPQMGNSQLNNFKVLTGLTPGKYYWSVQSIDKAYRSSKFAKVDSFTYVILPAIPKGLTATAGDTKVTLKWNKNTDANRYYIYWDVNDNPTTLKDTTQSATDTTKEISPLNNNTKYYFRVEAISDKGLKSGYSASVNATPNFGTPAAPKNLKASVEGTIVKLVWNKNTEINFLRYKIYRGTSQNPVDLGYYTSSSANSNDTTITIANMEYDITYYYTVTALNTLNKESVFSNIVEVMIQSETPVINSYTISGNTGIKGTSLAVSGLSVSAATSKKTTLVIRKVFFSPKIDGLIDNNDPWSLNDWVKMTANSNENRTSDLTSRFQLMYDDSNLYFIIEVAGDKQMDTSSIAIPYGWENDNVDMYIKMDTTSSSNGSYSSEGGDYQLRMRRASVYPTHFEAQVNIQNSVIDKYLKFTSDKNFKISQVNYDTKYIQEWQIPWNSLTSEMINTSFDKKFFKFEIQTDDNTTGFAGGRTQMLFWKNNSNSEWIDTRTFSVVELGQPSDSIITSDASGNYSFKVPYNWSGTVTPSKTGYTFNPLSRNYKIIKNNLNSENYSASPIEIPVVTKPMVNSISNMCPGDSAILKVSNRYNGGKYIWFEESKQLNETPVDSIKIKLFERNYTVLDTSTKLISDTLIINWKDRPEITTPKIYVAGNKKTAIYFATDAIRTANKYQNIQYVWHFNDLVNFNDQVIGKDDYYCFVNKPESGIYYLEIAETGKCSSFSKPDTILIDQKKSAQEIELFPNPAKEQITIRLTVEYFGETTFKVYNIMGQLHYSLKINADEMHEVNIPVGNLFSGYYYIEIKALAIPIKRIVFLKK